MREDELKKKFRPIRDQVLVRIIHPEEKAELHGKLIIEVQELFSTCVLGEVVRCGHATHELQKGMLVLLPTKYEHRYQDAKYTIVPEREVLAEYFPVSSGDAHKMFPLDKNPEDAVTE